MGIMQSELLLRVGPRTPQWLSSECMLVCMHEGCAQVVPASADHMEVGGGTMLANSTLNAFTFESTSIRLYFKENLLLNQLLSVDG